MGRARRAFPRSRLPLHRRPFADPAALRRWVLAVALAAATAGFTGRLVAGAEATRARWGRTGTVLVLDHRVAAGAPLVGATTPARWPLALIPAGALRSLPRHAVAAGPVAAGTAITSVVVAGPARARPVGRRIAVPAGSARLPLRIGDLVDVWATVDPSVSGGSLSTRRVAGRATVTAAGPETVVVAVAPAEVPELAEAIALATVTLVAVG